MAKTNKNKTITPEVELENMTPVKEVNTTKKIKVAPKIVSKTSKRFNEASKKVDNKLYPLTEAIELIKKLANAKFDESVEAHLRLGIDPSKTAQQVRGSVVLPHGTGRKIRILIFAEDNEKIKVPEVTFATDDITSQIEKGFVPFDIVIATPPMMPKIAKLARILGVRGLMPNPKNGTVAVDLAKTIKERSSGLVDFKNQSNLLHLTFGKASFNVSDLEDNFRALYRVIQDARPTKVNKVYIRNLSLSSTMGPGIKVDLASIKNT